MAEKESLMAQFKSVAEQKAVIDQAQEPLLKESNEIKKQIEAFDGQRQEAQVRQVSLSIAVLDFAYPLLQARITQAAEQRLAAQNEQHHWAKKLLDEEKKVRDAKEQLNLVQQEFEVSYGCTLRRIFLRWLFRSGREKRSSIALAFRILGKYKS